MNSRVESYLWSMTMVMTIDSTFPTGKRRRGGTSVPLENAENAGGRRVTDA